MTMVNTRVRRDPGTQ